MADPFSITTGTIGLAGTVAKIITACHALYGLWQDVKDVPERVGRLLEKIEIESVVLRGIEQSASEFCGRSRDGDRVISDIIRISEESKNDLETLVKDLGRDIHAEKKMMKLAARVRVVLKEDQLVKHESRLQNTLGLLTLALQLYNNAQQSQMIPMLQTIYSRSEMLVALQQTEQIEAAPDTRVHGADGMDRSHHSPDPYESALLYLGPTNKSYTVRLGLPRWLAHEIWDVTSSKSILPQIPKSLMEKAWEVGFARSILGWQTTLRVYNTIPFQADILRFAYDGDYSEITKLFGLRLASPLDVDADGWSLVDWAISGPSSLDTVRFLYLLGIRPKKHNGDRVSPLTGLARQCDPKKLGYALSLGYHEPAEDSARQYTACMVVAAATDSDMFNAVLDTIGAEYYYSIPLWIRLSYLTINTPSELLYRVVSPYIRHDSQFIPDAVQRLVDTITDNYPVLDRAMNAYWDPMSCMVEARTASQFQPQNLQVLQRSWQRLVTQVVRLTSRERDISYPEGTLSIFSAVRTWDCPSLDSRKRDELLSAIKAWLAAAEDCGLDLQLYSENVLDLLDTNLRQDGPWDRQWCHWCQQYGPTEHRGYKRLRLEVSSGPDALAWDLVWDAEAEEYTGDFWELVEKSGWAGAAVGAQLPGTWVD